MIPIKKTRNRPPTNRMQERRSRFVRTDGARWMHAQLSEKPATAEGRCGCPILGGSKPTLAEVIEYCVDNNTIDCGALSSYVRLFGLLGVRYMLFLLQEKKNRAAKEEHKRLLKENK